MNAARRGCAATVAVLALLAATTAKAGPAVTVYSGDLAFVRDVRTWDVRAANDTLRISDLPAMIDATSVRITLGGAGNVTRLAYRGDLASGETALANARGSQVRIAARDGRTVEGTLLSVDGSWLLVRSGDGTLHDVSRSAVEDVRIEAETDDVLRPTLEVAISGARRGAMETQIDYLTRGMSWSTEHTLVRGEGNRAEWSTMITVINQSGHDYVDAKLKLVAGDPRRAGASPQPKAMRTATLSYAEEASGAPGLTGEVFSEYHLYTLDPPATLRDRESQQLSMYATRDISVTPHYFYRGGSGVLAQLKIKNAKGEGLGVPLPGGRIRVFEADASGALQFTGESPVLHTPVDEEFTVDVGAAFDLVGERRVVREQRPSNRERNILVEIKLRNRKKAAVTIHIEEPMGGEFDITTSSHPFERKDSRTASADIQVPAGKEVVVTYEATIRY